MENEAPNTGSENQQTFTQSAPIGQTTQVARKSNTLMAVLAYFGLLIIIPFLFARDDAFVKFHIKQGLILVIVELLTSAFGMSMMWTSYSAVAIINAVVFVLSIFGIVYAIQGKEKKLPLVGHLSDNFTF